MENAIQFIVMMYAHVMLRARRVVVRFWPDGSRVTFMVGHIFSERFFLFNLNRDGGRIILFFLCY